MKNDSSQKMGLWSAVALVFSGMVGSGILFLPHTMASCKTWGLFSWSLGAVMTYCMFLSFARVNEYYLKTSKNKNPDIIDFFRLRYCKTTAFLLSFGHFAAMTVTGAVTALALGNYFLELFPGCIFCAKGVASISLLLMFVINLISFGAANALNFWLTIAKLIFFMLISILGVFYSSSYTPSFGSPKLLLSGAAMTMFAFMGIEFGIFASGSIKDPEENVIKATKYGLIASSIVFVGVYAATLFILPDLSVTKTPVYDCAVVLFGSIGAKIICAVAIFSCLTGLNGNLVVQGNSLRNFAKKRFLSRVFNNETMQGFPWIGALISLLISISIIWGPNLNLEVFGITFIGLLYLGVILLEIILNGFSSSSLLAVLSCAIMLFNSLEMKIILITALVYLFGYILKAVSSEKEEDK